MNSYGFHKGIYRTQQYTQQIDPTQWVKVRIQLTTLKQILIIIGEDGFLNAQPCDATNALALQSVLDEMAPPKQITACGPARTHLLRASVCERGPQGQPTNHKGKGLFARSPTPTKSFGVGERANGPNNQIVSLRGASSPNMHQLSICTSESAWTTVFQSGFGTPRGLNKNVKTRKGATKSTNNQMRLDRQML
jgi:hypothetical protein